jgi:hypothetical protein
VVQLERLRRGAAAAVLAGGLVAAGGLPAVAAPAPSPTITIAAKALFKPVTGDVFVVFMDGKSAKAQIRSTIEHAAPGEVAKLFAIPFNGPATQVGSKTLPGPSESYSFAVTPTLATRYYIEVFANSTSTTPLAKSITRTVYVSNFQTAVGLSKCPQTRRHPFCHQRIRVTESVPASTLKDEIWKHWYFYFAVNLSGTQTPPEPRFARLDTRVTISAPARRAASFTRTVSWSFWTGVNGYYFFWATCSKGTERVDGLGLPGRHACGVRVISTSFEYLG